MAAQQKFLVPRDVLRDIVEGRAARALNFLRKIARKLRVLKSRLKIVR